VRAAALVAAVAAAALLPVGAPGIGVAIVAVLVAATVALSHAPRSLDLVLFGALSVALASFAAIVDASWVVALDIAAALLLATVAVGGSRLTAPVAPLVALRLLPALAPRPGARSAPALRGALGGVLLVTPFGVLFWTGDAAFASLGRAVPVPVLGSLPAQAVTLVVVLVGSLALALAPRVVVRLPEIEIRRCSLLEWAVPLAALNLLFLLFIAVQGAAFLAGDVYIRRATGLTYAEYARHGFWQLLGAASLTLVVIGGASVLAVPRSPLERRVLRALLGSLSVLTLLTVVSALHRLRLYETAYGLSRLRLLAEAASLWLGGLFCVLLAAGGIGAVRRHLGRIVLAGSAAGLIAFTLANPDGLVARRNVERWRATGRLDVGYLRTLSADAVSSIASLPEPLRSRALEPIAARLSRDEPWSSWNRSRDLARGQLARAASVTRFPIDPT
jgi:hypothetical protein